MRLELFRRWLGELSIWVILGSAHYLSAVERPTNCLYLFDPSGQIVDRYDKSMLTDGDMVHYTPGDHLVTFTLKGIKCGLLICYDSCFPEMYNRYRYGGVQLMFHSFYNASFAGECGFPLERFEGQDMLMVAGGLGMVPLRGLVQYVIDLRDRFGRVILLYGTRSPDQVLFRDELQSVARRGDAEVLLTVDQKQDQDWAGHVGVVTEPLDDIRLDVPRTYAVACGPPVFYKFVMDRLVKARFAKDRIYLSLERRMECGVGKCGHCAVGYTFTCLHGPVFSFWDAMNLPELIYT